MRKEMPSHLFQGFRGPLRVQRGAFRVQTSLRLLNPRITWETQENFTMRSFFFWLSQPQHLVLSRAPLADFHFYTMAQLANCHCEILECNNSGKSESCGRTASPDH